jgi:tripartite-type tricarboxylate transporter receptor subunit TctC
MNCAYLAVAALVSSTLSIGMLAVQPAAAEVDFKGKTVTVILGTQPGDGTDAAARLMGRMLTKYLPGHPVMVYRNLPAGHGIQALNYFAEQVRPDGLTWFGGSGSSIRPETLRRKEVRFDPRNFHMFGGLPAPGGLVVVRKDAMPRLYDKSAEPVIMGDVDGNRASGQLGLWGPEFLGWNMKYVVGYSGTGAMTMAFKSGETHAYVTYNSFMLNPMKESGEYVFVVQAGFPKGGKFVARPDFADVPVLSDLVKSKLSGLELEAFEGWEAMVAAGMWYALPPKTPDEFVAAYRKAHDQAVEDPEFDNLTKKQYSEVYSTTNGEETDRMVHQLAEISDDVLDYIQVLKQKVGIPVGTGLLKMEKTVLSSVKDSGRDIGFTADEQAQTVKVGNRTRIVIGKKLGKAASLKPGMACEILFAGDGAEARSIRCGQ